MVDTPGQLEEANTSVQPPIPLTVKGLLLSPLLIYRMTIYLLNPHCVRTLHHLYLLSLWRLTIQRHSRLPQHNSVLPNPLVRNAQNVPPACHLDIDSNSAMVNVILSLDNDILML